MKKPKNSASKQPKTPKFSKGFLERISDPMMDFDAVRERQKKKKES
jgi:hypothetical protein